MFLGTFRQWWWKRGYQKFYRGEIYRENPYAPNAGTREKFDSLVKELTSILEPMDEDVVLDLGGGDGRLSGELFKGCRRVVVMDFCKAAMDSVLRLPRHFSFVIADIRRLPFKVGSFSKVFTYGTLPHLGSERQIRRMLETWDSLLSEGGVLYIGDIPDRKAIPSIVARAFSRIISVSGLKYCFAISMNNYFSKRRLTRFLYELGYEVKIVDQSSERRFHEERFDALATKSAS